MCGIVAVLTRRSRREPPALAELVTRLDVAVATLAGDTPLVDALTEAGDHARAVDAALHGPQGVRALLSGPEHFAAIESRLDGLMRTTEQVEARLDADPAATPPAELEAVNAALLRLKDALWSARRDRLRTAAAVAELAGGDTSPAALEAFTAVQIALSAIDRLEVRGRDSAGLHLLVHDHGLDLDAPEVDALVCARGADRLFGSGSVRTPGGALSFVYKAAAEIGDLGDNTALLRAAIVDDALLHRAVAADSAHVSVLGHTRWASVGLISEANAHPLDAEEIDNLDGPYVVGALNGDVDNYADLLAADHLRVAPEITTDAKVIPTLVSRRLAGRLDTVEAFRATVASLEGSVAVAASVGADPDELLLALRGSGQALYVGLAPDAFVVASEPYGLIEETSTYLRLDGETPSDPDRASATRGQIVVLDAAHAGETTGIRRFAYDGSPLPVLETDLQRAQITTRDIDRGDAPHFLLKEITEAPASFRKTLRGKIVERDGQLSVGLPGETLPESLRARLRAGEITRVFVIGQGTAAVAGQSLAAALSTAARSRFAVEALPATELSGFRLGDDMSDALVVAISQSGTTTDTNRTVDLARARGAAVVGIVNRRNSDLVDKADGVLFTSDGRDVEMSVASTKAFYAQIAAGLLLALALADEVGVLDAAWAHEVLSAMRELPDAMALVVDHREEIAAIAARHAPSRRYWAVVGNGSNRIAAQELRIKLSELCYKSIACDITEDKKHIDLSSEPLILVCAAGLSGSNADDVAKEVAIFRAHRAAPLVIATEGNDRFGAALETIAVPPVHPMLGFVLAAMAGHLFGYEAALAIDASARPLREARAAIERAISEHAWPDAALAEVSVELEAPMTRFLDGLRDGTYNGHLEAGTAVRITSLLRYALGVAPLDLYQLEHGKIGTPSAVLEDLTAALSAGIDELTRPIDAIKHQAKTVTVGISRSDETLLQVPLVHQLMETGIGRDSLSYRSLRTLVDLDPAVDAIVGFTRYHIAGDVAGDAATIHVVDRGGIARDLPSRTETDPTLRGTKHRAAVERETTVVRGAHDARTLIIVPEVKGHQTIGMTLLHVRFRDHLAPDAFRAVLQGYRGRYAALKDAVTETQPEFDDAVLGRLNVVDVLTLPVHVLAQRWRASQ
jgi:glutamine---fructose-6-phosphate transaminase (isomerizing)